MSWLGQRRREAEWMDDPRVDSGTLDNSLRFIRRINRVLGYTRATIHHLDRLTRNWPLDRSLWILDIATGSADIPRAILKWADGRQLDVRIVGMDLHAETIRVAASQPRDLRLHMVRGNVFAIPFADQSFDFVLTAMFLHHLDDEQVIEVLRTMHRLARHGIIVADLLRRRRAYLWICLLTVFSSAMVRHDAAVSVAQAFTLGEFKRLQARAGIEYAELHRHFGHRFVMAGRRN